MIHRIYISEFIREWNYKFRNSGEPKMTQIRLAESIIKLRGYKIVLRAMRNKITKMNIGTEKYINIDIVTDIAIILNCLLSELLNVADENRAQRIFKKYSGQKIKMEILYDLL